MVTMIFGGLGSVTRLIILLNLFSPYVMKIELWLSPSLLVRPFLQLVMCLGLEIKTWERLLQTLAGCGRAIASFVFQRMKNQFGGRSLASK